MGEKYAGQAELVRGRAFISLTGAPESQGIEMRVYYYGGPADGSRGGR